MSKRGKEKKEKLASEAVSGTPPILRLASEDTARILGEKGQAADRDARVPVSRNSRHREVGLVMRRGAVRGVEPKVHFGAGR